MDKHITIDDFDEKDFRDPISLLEAMSRLLSPTSFVSSGSADGLLSFSEVQEKYKLSDEYLQSALLAGSIFPAKVSIYFEPEEIERFISNNKLPNPLMTSFERELEKMAMNYSYKPLLILALLNNSAFRASVDEIIDYYFHFYSCRKDRNDTVEKADSSFMTNPESRIVARRTILRYPVTVLAKKNFVVFDKKSDTVALNPILTRDIDYTCKEHMKIQCHGLLEKYYSSIS